LLTVCVLVRTVVREGQDDNQPIHAYTHTHTHTHTERHSVGNIILS